jgi:hypothetical protein
MAVIPLSGKQSAFRDDPSSARKGKRFPRNDPVKSTGKTLARALNLNCQAAACA